METGVAVAAYLAQAQARNLSPYTIEAYRWGLSHITAPTLPDRPEEIEEILARAGRRLAPESLHDLWRYLGMFYRWANGRFGVTDPTAGVAAPLRPKLLPRCLSKGEVQALLDSCETERERLLVLVPLDTGLRLAEVAAMRQAHLGEDTVSVLGKGKKMREVPLSRSLAGELQGIGDRRHIWTTAQGKPLSTSGIKTVYRRGFARAGLKGGAHRLRHTFATEYLRNGGDLYRLSRILGHSSVAVTQRYLSLVVEDLVDEHTRVSPALRYLAGG